MLNKYLSSFIFGTLVICGGVFSGWANEGSGRAHADHSTKHGGQFFMAPDGFHHLEGAMPTEKEFRIYFYDDYTRPVSASGFLSGAGLEVDRMIDGRETGKPQRVELKASAKGDYLFAIMPKGVNLPLACNITLRFPKQKTADLFNFYFTEISKVHSGHEHSHHHH